MSYQVLARKYRPGQFSQLVGQRHVVEALTNALTQQRLHHAYLFTGTRGVGKTTIARILSKSLNCLDGITAEPCGTCEHCHDIDDGRFVDLIEVDAASRTKVEDTRELLDNVQYAPTRGRYKVYLIDEVHMLSRHSFNALLKTLEEPPPHVVFLLATTDPQKLPITVLSRCLQFNLKALSKDQIGQHLQNVLAQENVQFDDAAIRMLATAASGSIRDSLSLTDQAIAQGNGSISESGVRSMLGLLDDGWVHKLAAAIIKQDKAKALQVFAELSSLGPDYSRLLAELAQLWHLIAMTQFVPDAAAIDEKRQGLVQKFAQAVSAEQVQVFYQLAIQGRRDIPYAPDPAIGAEMTVMRMLAFQPLTEISAPVATVATQSSDIDVDSIATQKVESHASADPVRPSAANTLTPSKEESAEAPIATAQLAAEPAETPTEPQQSKIPQQAGEKAEPMSAAGADEPEAASHDEEAAEPEVQTSPAPGSSSGGAPMPQAAPIYESEQAAMEAMARDQLDLMAQADQQGIEHYDYHAEHAATAQGSYNPGAEANAEQDADFQSEQVNDVRQQSQQSPAEAETSLDEMLNARNILRSRKIALEQEAKKPETNNRVDKRQPGPRVGATSVSSTQAEAKEADAEEPDAVVEPEIVAVDPVSNQFDALPDVDAAINRLSAELDVWAKAIDDMQLGGRLRQLAIHSSIEHDGNTIRLSLDPEQKHLNSEAARGQIEKAMALYWQKPVELELQEQKPKAITPYQIQQHINQQRQHYAEQVIADDEIIQKLQQQFAAVIEPESIKPL